MCVFLLLHYFCLQNEMCEWIEEFVDRQLTGIGKGGCKHFWVDDRIGEAIFVKKKLTALV